MTKDQAEKLGTEVYKLVHKLLSTYASDDELSDWAVGCIATEINHKFLEEIQAIVEEEN